MIKEYQNITTPEELLEWMSNITYGYKGKSKLHYFEDEDFNDVWYDEYLLSEPHDVINSKVGNCWDQTELERDWFLKNNYKTKTIYEMINLSYENPYPTHSFLIYQDNDNNWCWFENSDYNNRGIHKKKTLNELIEFQLNKYKELLNSYNISNEEISHLVLKEFEKPKPNINASEYIEHVLNSKEFNRE